MHKKIGILIVAYNAVNTLAKVLDRIPPAIREKIAEVVVFDDCSSDDTYLLGVGYREEKGWDKLKVFRNSENLGYGGNQKRGYRYAIDHGLDIIVLLHGDGQYAPECMQTLLDPLEAGEAEAVLGSRMMEKGAARKGGMPLYKYIGNRILTTFENTLLDLNLSEFHSGYRAYDVHALAKIPFEKNTDGFHFDTEIIIQFHQHNMRIVERPIPTYYGSEICYVNGLTYAGNVFKTVLRYRLQKSGARSYPQFAEKVRYPLKRDPHSSHALISNQIKGQAPRVLDVGCGQGNIAALLKNKEFYYVGVDIDRADELHPNVDVFHQKDIEQDFDFEYGNEFDYIVFGDILEHLRRPEDVLRKCHRYLKPGGRVIVSVPNILHWSIRLMISSGRFTYMERGILDKTHLRFFTRKSMKKLLLDCGFKTLSIVASPVPLSALVGKMADSRIFKIFSSIQFWVANFWKNLFAYQLIFMAEQMEVGPDAIGADPGLRSNDEEQSPEFSAPELHGVSPAASIQSDILKSPE